MQRLMPTNGYTTIIVDAKTTPSRKSILGPDCQSNSQHFGHRGDPDDNIPGCLMGAHQVEDVQS